MARPRKGKHNARCSLMRRLDYLSQLVIDQEERIREQERRVKYLEGLLNLQVIPPNQQRQWFEKHGNFVEPYDTISNW